MLTAPCDPREIRTLTITGLSRMPLPIGLPDHSPALSMLLSQCGQHLTEPLNSNFVRHNRHCAGHGDPIADNC